MYCKECGKYLSGHVNFCSNCGARIEEEDRKKDVKVFASADELEWDVQEFPSGDIKKTQDIDFDWGDDKVFSKPAKNKKNADKSIHQQMFGVNEEKIEEGQEKIEKFYTFSAKKEEFQKLLDQEYERIRNFPTHKGLEEGIEDVLDVQRGVMDEATSELESKMQKQHQSFGARSKTMIDTSEESEQELKARAESGFEASDKTDAEDSNEEYEVKLAETPKVVEVVTEEKTNEKDEIDSIDSAGGTDTGNGSVGAEADHMSELCGKNEESQAEEGKKEDSKGFKKEPGDGEKACKEGSKECNRRLVKEDEKTAAVVIEPDNKIKDSETAAVQAVKDEKNAQVQQSEAKENKPKGRSRFTKFIIAFLMAVAIVLLCLIIIRKVAPNSTVSQNMDIVTGHVMTFIDENFNSTDKQTMPEGDKNQLVNAEAGKNYKGEISEIIYDESLKFDKLQDTSKLNVAELRNIDNEVIYKEEGKEIRIEQALIGKAISYVSQKSAFVNQDDQTVFSLFEKESSMRDLLLEHKAGSKGKKERTEQLAIGDIKQSDSGYYIILREKRPDGSESSILEMKKEGETLLITNKITVK